MISNLRVEDRLGKSDHNIVKFEIKTNFSLKRRSFIKPDFGKANFERFRNGIGRIEKSPEIEVESKWNAFKGDYNKNKNDCIPQLTINSNKPEQPKWFNSSIAKQIGRRQKAHKISKINPTQKNVKLHKQQCRMVDKMVKRSKIENEHRVAAAANRNPKVFYAHVNSRKPVKSAIGPLKDEQSNIISCDEGMADLLNRYFTTVYTVEDLQEIPSVPVFYQGTKPLRKINLTVERIREKIRKLNGNKSPGSDGWILS